jgi:hypothetical protein
MPVGTLGPVCSIDSVSIGVLPIKRPKQSLVGAAVTQSDGARD